MPGNHGGPRPGAGAKPKAERFAAPISEASEILAASLPSVARALIKTAEGGVRTVGKRVALCTLFYKAAVRKADGTVFLDGKGKPVIEQVPIVINGFGPLDLVTVEERDVEDAGDGQAADRILSRLMGTPGPEPADEAEKLDLRAALGKAREILRKRQAPAPPPGDDP